MAAQAQPQLPLPLDSMLSHAPSELPTRLPLRCSIQSTPDDDDQEPHDVILSRKWLSKANALCKNLWPSAKQLTIKYLSHGSYNTVFSILMVTADNQTVDYVLRIPETHFPILRTAAIHEYLAHCTNLKVPRVITWDEKDDNALENGYIILSRIPGKSVQDAWGTLSHEHKLSLARQLAQQLLEIESVTNPSAGTLKVHEKGFRHGDEVKDRLFVETLGTDVHEEPEFEIDYHNSDNGLLPLDRLHYDPPNMSVKDIMLALFKRRLYQEKNQNRVFDSYVGTFGFCQEIMEDMANLGVFSMGSDAICLHHADLFPRNIMVDFTPDLTITGILDWDHTLFVPRFACRIPPRWLWRSLPEDRSEYYKFDREPLIPEENEPDSPENEEIKKAFESVVGESWVAEATGKWYPFARRLLKVARESAYDGEDIDCVYDWAKKHRAMLRGDASESDDSGDSDDSDNDDSDSDESPEDSDEDREDDGEDEDEDDGEADGQEDGELVAHNEAVEDNAVLNTTDPDPLCPLHPDVNTSATTVKEEDEAGPATTREPSPSSGSRIILEGPMLYVFLSFAIVQTATVLGMGIWLLAGN
ncbi:hypothetical protein GGR53DRAFT_527014 [Hypoxylon sp. FL1150]|nr:hypothetical protein GGR53DRAFT_527014 [Hypoxylon sp. FL1150]